MGVFHCPVGSAYYEDEPCLDCRLCLATTEEEIGLASKKIRDYWKSRSNPRRCPGRKIAVCGKGGTGKSTIVALVARAFVEFGYSVLVIDLDESNAGLQRMFGFNRQSKPLMGLLEKLPSGEVKSGAEWFNQDNILLPDIPAEYILGRDSLRFLMVGKITDPFQGCACSMADLARDFIKKLALSDKEIVLMDMEAGIESFGRGIEGEADTVLIAVEPSSASLAVAEKISYLADGLGVKTVRAIPNRIPSEKVDQRIIENLEKKKIKVIGSIYLDRQISDANLEGCALPENSMAHTAVREIARRLLDESP